ncbi:cytochrome-c oxidase, cbb3-type subunit III [Oceanobacter mangrovi]|uniref:cytochrome-c oxidase, cbb3-type subunit III n=1 Tax=Oceanobacter mangrovi TaxID=2862510 RepID=UPI001C8DAC63|nr:cytochrome-c oxidase, cbb3-type subunit III [Oceanobacter mangrovi]
MLGTFWQVWITLITVGSIVGCGILIVYTSRGMRKEETTETTGHDYDGIQEIDNPLPRWWVFMFWATILFGLAYLGMYGFGNYKGVITVTVDGQEVNWTAHNQWKAEVQAFDAEIAPLYAKYSSTPVAELIHNDEALQTGQRLFKSNCSVCHGSTAKGALGFPNLTDKDWLYGGQPAQIVQTITNGRQGAMPAWEAVLGDEGVNQMVNYVRSLSGLKHEAALAEAAAPKFLQNCAICHGADGKGNILMGAPNLTDEIWLYGGSSKQIEMTLRHGRAGKMPAHKEILGANADAKIHLLATYVYSLSNK